MVTLALAWLWVVGIVFLWRSGRPLWRALVWAYALLFVLFALTTGAKIITWQAAYVSFSPRGCPGRGLVGDPPGALGARAGGDRADHGAHPARSVADPAGKRSQRKPGADQPAW